MRRNIAMKTTSNTPGFNSGMSLDEIILLEGQQVREEEMQLKETLERDVDNHNEDLESKIKYLNDQKLFDELEFNLRMSGINSKSVEPAIEDLIKFTRL